MKTYLPIIIAVLIIAAFVAGTYINRPGQLATTSDTTSSPDVPTTQSTQTVRTSQPSTPATNIETELANSDVVKGTLTKEGPNSSFDILEKHTNDIYKLNIRSGSTGYALWIKKTNGSWIEIFEGQGVPPCPTLEAASIEPGIQCVRNNQESVTK